MLHSRACRHCVGQFSPVRTGHLYCSETCRKLAFKSKNRAKTQAKRNKKLSEKLKKLANSAFGLYLVKEIKRAKTVEILQGHDFASLTALVSLRRRCTAVSGYEKGESLGYYELSHIYPVSGKERAGLLTPANLVITPHKFNRKHGTKLPIEGYLGASIPRESLSDKWKVSDSLTALEVLKLARKYIGEEFDIWLKKHLISQTQRQAILKKFKEAGYDYEVLKTLKLRELKAMADEEEMPYFSIDKEPEDDFWLASEELNRLSINNSITDCLQSIKDDELSFYENSSFIGHKNEEKEFRGFLVEQALYCLHGQPFEIKWKKKPVNSYFGELVNKPVIHSKNSYLDDDIL